MSGTRFVTKLSGQEIRSYVKLALAEIRRGRHRDVTAGALVEDSARAQEFMFWFIRKRRPELELNGDALTGWTERLNSETRVGEGHSSPSHVPLSLESISERVIVARITRLFREKKSQGLTGNRSRMSSATVPEPQNKNCSTPVN